MRSLSAPFLVTAGILIGIAGGIAPGSAAERQPAPKDAYAYIGWPNDGEVVTQRFKVWLGLRNFGVAPSGIVKPNTGHHHLLIDTDLPPLDEPIPNDRKHIHLGAGQTETYLSCRRRHTIQLLMGDADHVPMIRPSCRRGSR